MPLPDAPPKPTLCARKGASRLVRHIPTRFRDHTDNTTGKHRRDADSFAKYASISHDASSEGYTLDTPLDTIFDSNATCALVPEVTIGPYYVEGELIREDITDGQSGVPTHLDFQFVDINTCEPVSELLIDAWHCNSTGVYSGVSATGQGGLNTTFNRGVQETDSDGVVQFDTTFPGHYTGRATHIHVMSTANATVLGNGTFSGGTSQHIGQTFFDTSLRELVESVEPYLSNTQEVTSNDEDTIAVSEATAEYDPFMKYVQLGEDISDGLLMWITIAIDTTADYNEEVSAAAHYYKGGGVDEASSGGGSGGNGTGPGNGTAPEGAPPGVSGTASTVSVPATSSAASTDAACTG